MKLVARLLAFVLLAFLPFTFLFGACLSLGVDVPDAGRPDSSTGKRDATADVGADTLVTPTPDAGDETAGDEDAPVEEAGEDAGVDASDCTVTLSGAASGTYSCTADLAYDPQAGTVLALDVPSLTTFSFVSVLSTSSLVATGSYAAANAVEAHAAYANASGGAWGMAFDVPGQADAGSFTIDVQSTGARTAIASGKIVWLDASGTATADLPSAAGDAAAPGDAGASGTVTITASWTTSATPPDGGSPEGGPVDAGGDSEAGPGCTATLTGDLSDTLACSVTAYYAQGSSQTTFSVAFDPGDSGLSVSSVVVLSGAPTTGTTYGPASPDLVSEGASILQSTDGGTLVWSAQASDAGAAGTFSLGFTTLGFQQQTTSGLTYVGPHGALAGTLPPAGAPADAGGVNLNVAF